MEKRNSSSNKLGRIQTLVSCLFLFSCGLLIKNHAEESPYKRIRKYQYENAREWSPELVGRQDSLSGIHIDFIFDNTEDSSFIPEICSSGFFTLWRYPVNVSQKAFKRKELSSLPKTQEPRNITYEYYEIRGEPIKPQKLNLKDKFSFNVPIGNYLVLFAALGFQQDLIGNVEVRRGQYSRLEVYVRREPVNVY